MKYFKKLLSFLIISILLITGSFGNISFISSADAAFEQKLLAFPESYRPYLRDLHNTYPNWEFIADYISTDFSWAVYQQTLNSRKQVSKTQPVSWRSMESGYYDWNKSEWVYTNGGWTGASKEIISFYMDPRNFLNSTEIYQFMQQSYNPSYQTIDGLRKVVAGSFLAGTYYENGIWYNYVDVIMRAAAASNVNPYIIASKIIQEQGSAGSSSLISGTYSGYEGLYNFFNVGASGANDYLVIINGLTRARTEGWTTRELSITGGAKFLAKNYISVGQDTYYYQDYNVKNPDSLWHQYAQAVHDAYNKGVKMADTYKSDYSLSLSFKIPVFSAMTDTACPKPVQSNAKNNYYFEKISIIGADSMTPTFSKFTYNYDLLVNNDITVYVEPVSGASYAGNSSYQLVSGDNIVFMRVKAETGYILDYTLNIRSNGNYTLNVNSGNAPAPSTPSVIKGDVSGDGQITIRDLADIRLYLLGMKTLDSNKALAADVSGDGNITIRDLADVRLYLLGMKNL